MGLLTKMENCPYLSLYSQTINNERKRELLSIFPILIFISATMLVSQRIFNICLIATGIIIYLHTKHRHPINKNDSLLRNTLSDDDIPCFYICPEECAKEFYKDIIRPGGDRGDSGIDLIFPNTIEIPGQSSDQQNKCINLGIRVRCISKGKAVPYTLMSRSSIYKTPLCLANGVALIDGGYTGELKVAFQNFSPFSHTIKKGTALIQLVTRDLSPAKVRIVGPGNWAIAQDTIRGEGGFGSTGEDGIFESNIIE